MRFGVNSRYQWSYQDILECVQFLKSRDFFVIGITDGVFSALRRIGWSRVEGLGVDKGELIFDVRNSGQELISRVSPLFDSFVIEAETIRDSLKMIVRADVLVTTSGTFAASIFSNFGLEGRAKIFNIREILGGCISFD